MYDPAQLTNFIQMSDLRLLPRSAVCVRLCAPQRTGLIAALHCDGRSRGKRHSQRLQVTSSTAKKSICESAYDPDTAWMLQMYNVCWHQGNNLWLCHSSWRQSATPATQREVRRGAMDRMVVIDLYKQEFDTK